MKKKHLKKATKAYELLKKAADVLSDLEDDLQEETHDKEVDRVHYQVRSLYDAVCMDRNSAEAIRNNINEILEEE